jgi:peptidoglycan/LPS O-acetylase OafA/YrhL
MKKLGYVPALDGLRGVAIALVVVYHAGLLPGGFLGVDLFFVLSGFLITTLLLEEHAASGVISLRRFYVRRARRLLPALLALLALLTIGAVTSSPVNTALLGDIGWTLAYAANIVRATGHHFLTPLTTMWSLAEEEQFYFLWPGILIACLARFTPRRIGWALFAVACAVSAWRVTLTLSGASTQRIVFSPDSHFDPLLIGCALAFLCRARPRLPVAWPVAGPLLAAVVALAVSGSRFSLLAGYSLAGLACAGLVSDAAAGRARALAWQPLVWLGKISYSLYIWQALAFALAYASNRPLPIFLPLAVGLAWLSYRYVEEPFRRATRRVEAPAVTAVV